MALGQDIERLAQIPLLRVMEPDALRLLAFAGETRIVLADTALFQQGEKSNGGYLVLSGSFLLHDRDGQGPRFGPGTLLGEAALLRETVHERSAVAEETSTVFKVPRTTMLRVLEEHPVSAQRLLGFLAQRLNRALVLPAGDA
ncbi:cyclic nucleotide-binding domain-containing protein [Lichenifustis flavocetrariae]|uniref:Cyclic nucleotide-binding domain-containing protein n=1 Tax=Lichenifustis flavocetrariae TaxID=2949735 RepID=A0AA42CLF6_9HYPH|nr:cyclic nucleotide-binding domain-containing protein [Lichenifustis flavocetrariae]MCW6507250.1 cyclic nucleotide-binding domain-containing protein [Lichenifustis flavocetrariae]